MLRVFLTLFLSMCFIGLSTNAAASYTLELRPKMGCSEGQVSARGSCVNPQEGDTQVVCSVQNCQAPSACLPNGEQ